MALFHRLIFLVMVLTKSSSSKVPPNIVFVVADDLGWNDVSWHNNRMVTPHLEKLAKNGLLLENYYVQPLCTPSRSSFLTGYYPYHIGTQHGVFQPQTNVGLNLSLETLPELLKHSTYKTHLIGKWHLGFCNWAMTPTYRGFDSFYGFYNGQQDYFTHRLHCSHTEPEDSCQGLDFRCNTEVVLDKNNTYSTDVFGAKAVETILKHPKNDPLFLMVAYQAVHAPLQRPLGKSPKVTDDVLNRRIYSSMVTAMDKSIQSISSALEQANMTSNTIFIFSSDNGGQTLFGGNNWPLRGNKDTLWEGGTKAIGFINSPILPSGARKFQGLFHAVDWLPTILDMAGASSSISRPSIDGVSQWEALKTLSNFPREEFVYNIYQGHHRHGRKSNAGIRIGNFKLLVGNPGTPDGWIPPPGENGTRRPNDTKREKIYLFDLEKDPGEKKNLADDLPNVVKVMQRKLGKMSEGYVNPPRPKVIPEGNPKHWGDVFTPGWC